MDSVLDFNNFNKIEFHRRRFEISNSKADP